MLYIDNDELRQLETFARRIRGEVFFARRWLIVEGQSEYLLMHALGRQLGYDLDEHGVSVIDSVNNGNPATFAALARAFGIPWLALLDGDDEGQRYVTAIAKRGFHANVIAERCRTHPAGTMEQQLFADGLEPELRGIAQLWSADAATMTSDDLLKYVETCKTAVAAELAERLATDSSLAARMPKVFRDGIAALKGLS